VTFSFSLLINETTRSRRRADIEEFDYDEIATEVESGAAAVDAFHAASQAPAANKIKFVRPRKASEIFRLMHSRSKFKKVPGAQFFEFSTMQVSS
jgi:hypothetical protein